MSYCFDCGTIGHFFKSCATFDKDCYSDNSTIPYDLTLKAPPLRRQKAWVPEVVYVVAELGGGAP
ncbi:hypothetical protein ACS0TY_003963 [Phlomoides rotata]